MENAEAIEQITAQPASAIRAAAPPTTLSAPSVSAPLTQGCPTCGAVSAANGATAPYVYAIGRIGHVIPSKWVEKEIITGLEKEDELTRTRGAKVRVLVPLNLDGYIFSDQWKSGYRAEIRRRLAGDFTGWAADRAKFEEQVENLIRALRADAAAREAPPESKL